MSQAALLDRIQPTHPVQTPLTWDINNVYMPPVTNAIS